MIAVDYIILAIILIISAVMGLVRGLLREAIAVITWFLAIVLAWTFGSSLEPSAGRRAGRVAAADLGRPHHHLRRRALVGRRRQRDRLDITFASPCSPAWTSSWGSSSASCAASSSWARSRSPSRRCAWTRTRAGRIRGCCRYAIGVADALRGIVGEKLERLEMKLDEKVRST